MKDSKRVNYLMTWSRGD